VIFADDSELAYFSTFYKEVAPIIETASKSLAQATFDHATQLAHEKLHARRETYLSALDLREEDGAFLVILKPKALWIEDGVDPHDMIDDLLKSPKAKISKDGSKYLAIPFEHASSQGKNVAPRSIASSLQEVVRRELENAKIGLDIEKHPDGRPKTGLLHRLNLGGPIMRGGAGSRLLDGVSVYQRQTATGTVKEALTFRTVSSNSAQSSWQYPGLDGVKIMKETAKWAEDQWNKISQEILKKI